MLALIFALCSVDHLVMLLPLTSCGRSLFIIRLRCNSFVLGFVASILSPACLLPFCVSLLCLLACCLRFSVLFVSCRLSVLCRFSSALSVRLFALYHERLFFSPSSVMSLSPIMGLLGCLSRPYPMTFLPVSHLCFSIFLYWDGWSVFPFVARAVIGLCPFLCLPCW